MMIDKDAVQQAIKQVLGNRPLVLLIILMAVVGFIFSIVVAIGIHPNGSTIYTRYTAFGEEHFYKPLAVSYYFVLFGPLVVLSHTALMIKLFAIERRQTAILVGWVGIAILVVAFVYAKAVMGLGSATINLELPPVSVHGSIVFSKCSRVT